MTANPAFEAAHARADQSDPTRRNGAFTTLARPGGAITGLDIEPAVDGVTDDVLAVLGDRASDYDVAAIASDIDRLPEGAIWQMRDNGEFWTDAEQHAYLTEPTSIRTLVAGAHDTFVDKVDGKWQATTFIPLDHPADLVGLDRARFRDLDFTERRAVFHWLEDNYPGSVAHVADEQGRLVLEVDGHAQDVPFTTASANTSLAPIVEDVRALATPGQASPALRRYLDSRVFTDPVEGVWPSPTNVKWASKALDRIETDREAARPLSDWEAAAVAATYASPNVQAVLAGRGHADRSALRLALVAERDERLGASIAETRRALAASEAMLAWLDGQKTFSERL